MALKIALIGGGRMGQAMMQGWINQKLDLEISLFDPILSEEWQNKLDEAKWHYNPYPSKGFDIVMIAVKPQMFGEIIDNILAQITDENSIILSIMAGIGIDKIASSCPSKKICRAMPNTPGQIGAGVTGIIGNNAFNADNYAIIESLLAPLGEVVRLENEGQIDGLTSISGSGPAYVFLFAEMLAKAGMGQGIEENQAKKLALETIYGAAMLMKQSGRDPETLRKEVTSPNGTTQAAIEAFNENDAFENIIKKAVDACADRSRELGN